MSLRRFSPETHEKIEDYLPGYINCRLSSEQQRQIQAHTNQCSDCFELLQKEQRIRQLLLDTPPELKWLASDQRTEQTLADLLSGAEISASFWRKRVWDVKRGKAFFVAAGLPLSSAICGIVFVLLMTEWLRPELVQSVNLFRGSIPSRPFDLDGLGSQNFSSGLALGGQNYRIIFKTSMRKEPLSALLSQLSAQVENGPSDRGVYVISVPSLSNKQARILDSLGDGAWITWMAVDANYTESGSGVDL